MFETFEPSTFATMQDLLPSIGQVVTIEKCIYYLSLIERISNLRDLFVDHLNAFHARAEMRYEYWVDGCKSSIPGPLVAPPIDVAYIMHAHLVSPFRYYEDCVRLNLPMLPMPLQQVHIQRDEPTEESLQFWKQCAPHEPYLLTLDSIMGNVVLKSPCHNCKSILSIASCDYGIWRFNSSAYIQCWHCDIEFNMHRKAMIHLMTDIRDKKNYVRGTMITPSGKIHQESIIPSNYNAIYAKDYFEGSYKGTTTKEFPRQAFKSGSVFPSILHDNKDIFISTTNSIDDLGQYFPSSKNKKRSLIQTLRCTYSDTNPSPFSLDLLQAIERQHVVGSRMLKVNWRLPDSVVRGLRNYKKFLLLMKSDRNLIGVPTLEIDVSWHTHQLHPVDYRRFTSNYISRVINHDDTIPQQKLDIYSNYTRMAWEKKMYQFTSSFQFNIFRHKEVDFGKDYVHGLLEIEERVYDCCCHHHHHHQADRYKNKDDTDSTFLTENEYKDKSPSIQQEKIILPTKKVSNDSIRITSNSASETLSSLASSFSQEKDLVVNYIH